MKGLQVGKVVGPRDEAWAGTEFGDTELEKIVLRGPESLSSGCAEPVAKHIRIGLDQVAVPARVVITALPRAGLIHTRP